MAKYTAHHPKMPNRPGVNWVEKAGGLPKPIDAVARALVAKGWPQQRAIATAVNHVKKVCATGRAFGGRTAVSAEAKAKACAAVARWEAMKASTSIASDDRLAIELAKSWERTGSLELSWQAMGQAIEMAGAPRAGLVQVAVQVRNRQGKTFTRKVWVRPKQAKAMRARKGGRKVSGQGARVTGAQSRVLEELSKIPAGQRPKGWQRLVKALVDPRHGGRLGPEKRRLLHSVARQLPAGSPLRTAAAGALKADAPADADKPKRRAKGQPARLQKQPRKPKTGKSREAEKAKPTRSVAERVKAWNGMSDDKKYAAAKKVATWKDDHWEGNWPGKKQGLVMFEDGSIGPPPKKRKGKTKPRRRVLVG